MLSIVKNTRLALLQRWLVFAHKFNIRVLSRVTFVIIKYRPVSGAQYQLRTNHFKDQQDVLSFGIINPQYKSIQPLMINTVSIRSLIQHALQSEHSNLGLCAIPRKRPQWLRQPHRHHEEWWIFSSGNIFNTSDIISCWKPVVSAPKNAKPCVENNRCMRAHVDHCQECRYSHIFFLNG